MKHSLPILLTMMAVPALAEETRELDAHEHGVGELNIAVDGETVAIEFHAPGADIVGFEYEATNEEDLAAIETATSILSNPLDLFVFPDTAGCSVVSASAELDTEEDGHDDHDDHADEHHDEHSDDHDEHGDDHAHKEHKDEHADEHHDEHDHEHAHDEHADEAGHTEFHAEYMLTCATPSAISAIELAYFATFPNARELVVQVVGANGASAFEVERDAPTLDVSGLF
ncbi:zinc uptake protein ZrgA [Shimia abyssi]|uniref:Uncharacterized protein DUF2796 n=1 Tax=Shimia abyssi TaxID=1662395 RepID=A0A2P8FFG1_9RHOB|nr:DUF2796 domain-containing protein [Shimia abyssi]PSL20428.1 uncharacterized protein DUF2796 [Shimia abyssi]